MDEAGFGCVDVDGVKSKVAPVCLAAVGPGGRGEEADAGFF